MADKLALFGGTKVRVSPMPFWPYFDDAQIEKAGVVLRSGRVNYWTGCEGRLFEKEFSSYLGCEYGVALSNGTVALELSLKAFGVKQGDEIITTSRTFIATASAIALSGATPVIADIDLNSQNITADTIAKEINSFTKGIVVVHLAGFPCDMDPIMELAKKYNLFVIEDCAQAHGAKYKGRNIGTIGNIGVFSFCQDKIMTTAGEGGFVATHNRNLWRYVWEAKDHGKNYDLANAEKKGNSFIWMHESFGSNYRMTEIQSALGRIQLSYLDDMVIKRRENASYLDDLLSDYDDIIRIVKVSDDYYHSYYKYYCFINSMKLAEGWDRDKVVQAFNAEGIPCFTGSCPEIYLEKAFTNKGFYIERKSNAKLLGDTSLLFLVHPTIEKKDIYDIKLALDKISGEAFV